MLSKHQKHIVAIGLTLAGDFLKLYSKNEESEFNITKNVAEIVQELELNEEFGKACAETASLGKIFRECKHEIISLTKQ